MQEPPMPADSGTGVIIMSSSLYYKVDYSPSPGSASPFAGGKHENEG